MTGIQQYLKKPFFLIFSENSYYSQSGVFWAQNQHC